MKARQALVALLIVVGLSSPVSGQWNDGDGEVPETEWRQWEGDFGAMLLLTGDAEKFFAEWNVTPSQDYMPAIGTVSTALRGDVVTAVIVFSGCAANESGDCVSEVDFRVLFPDGSVYGEFDGAELWSDKPAAPSPRLQVGVGNLGIKVEPDDPFGLYRVEAIVRDKVGLVELELVQQLEVVEKVPPPPPATSFRLFPFNDGLSVFMQSYIAEPSPEGALDQFFAIDLEEFERLAKETEHPHARSVLIAFYVQLLNKNPIALSFAARLVAERMATHASFGTDVIAASATKDREKALSLIIERFDLPAEAIRTIESKTPFDYHELQAEHHQALDILWACYFATGEAYFVEKIARVLDGHPVDPKDALERIRALGSSNPQPGTSDHRAFWSLAVGEAARMGLTLNSREYDTVREILERLTTESGTSLSAILRSILESANNDTESTALRHAA